MTQTAFSVSPPNHWLQTNQSNPNTFTTLRTPIQFLRFPNTNNQNDKKYLQTLRFTLNSSSHTPPPVVVVGSVNADIYVDIDRLPKEGETVSAKSGQTLAGGKGANQACCGAKLSHPTYFVGQIGSDAHGNLVADALRDGGVRLDYLTVVPSAPTGHAVVMLQSDGQNSIVIVGGANMSFWPQSLPRQHLELVSNAGIVLLQREIPDFVNIQVAKVCTLHL